MYTSSFEQCLDLKDIIPKEKTYHKEPIRTDIKDENQFNRCMYILNECGIVINDYSYDDYRKEHPFEEYEFIEVED